MNFADIQNAWQSPRNRPTAAQLEKDKMNFITDLRRRHRDARNLLILVSLPLVYFTAKIGFHVLWPDPALDRVDLAREWAIIPFFVLPWIGWFALLRLHLRHRARTANYDLSIQASVRALLDENRTERTRTKVVAALLLVSALVLPVIIMQLRAVGKAGNEILIPGLVIYPAYVLIMLAWFAYTHRKKLVPRKSALESLLKSYDENPQPPHSSA